MANSHYQTATTPRLYVSYPLFQYANGALDSVNIYQANNNEEDLYRLLQLDPSNFTILNPLQNITALTYRLVPESDNFTDLLKSNLWNFNYAMFLGHNFASAGVIPRIVRRNDFGSQSAIQTTNIINHTPESVPEYDGFSIMQLQGSGAADDYKLKLELDSENGFNELPILLGSIAFGKYFDFPQNCNLSTSTTYDYGIRQKQTRSGKTISTANWTKTNNWITEPFGLGNERGDNFQRRSGRRSWSLSFDSLAPKYVMNQNNMMNDNGWKHNYDNFDTTDSNDSLYNINNGLDFFTTVVNKCMGSHLPMVLQLDKDNPTPDQFAIVRMNKNYKIIQKSPNLYNISLTLTEQI
jgi:hypothetical protein|tara:strand:- start:354 stop:1409 length:1056 start_codon:yes stop_codon:yes gene_type:complete